MSSNSNPRRWSHRTLVQDSDTEFTGLVCPYNSWSEPMGYYNEFKERFLPGAFDECLSRRENIICTIDHDYSKLLGDTESGTLKIANSSEGLRAVWSRVDLSYANDYRNLIKAGMSTGMSFTFRSVDEEYGKEDGIRTRTIKKADIKEVCFTAFPAYSATTAELRRKDSAIQTDITARLKLLEVISCR